MSRDRVYVDKQQVADFVFDQQVTDVFTDMISRSVPGYAATIVQIGVFCERFAQAGSVCYDLGCSLGAATCAMAARVPCADVRIIAVDNSAAMIAGCRAHVATTDFSERIELRCEDINDVVFARGQASMVVLNFTLQFIPVAQRDALIARLYDALMPGGIVVISEKIRFDDAHIQGVMTDMHHAFKAAQGYSDLEISQKRQSLENVLLPESLAVHQRRMHVAGFSSCDVWFQCFNFMSLVAIK